MDLTQYRDKLIGDNEERAVSPVIGVILMVAITVILAAVIAAFVLDIGDLGDTAPSASFDWDQDNDNDEDHTVITLEHTGGDQLDSTEITVQTIDGDPSPSDSDGWNDGDFDISAGDTHVMDTDNGADNIEGGTVIQIVWESDDGSSQILDDFEVNDFEDS